MEKKMNIFDIAIEIEISGEQFYRGLGENSSTPGMRSIFSMLADEETNHREIFEKMKQGSEIGMVPDTDINSKVDSIFRRMKKEDILSEKDQVEVYGKALGLEQKSIEYYTELLNSISDEDSKNAVRKIIKEEKKHERLIDYIIEHVSRPETWVEDAEFYLQDEY